MSALARLERDESMFTETGRRLARPLWPLSWNPANILLYIFYSPPSDQYMSHLCHNTNSQTVSVLKFLNLVLFLANFVYHQFSVFWFKTSGGKLYGKCCFPCSHQGLWLSTGHPPFPLWMWVDEKLVINYSLFWQEPTQQWRKSEKYLVALHIIIVLLGKSDLQPPT